MESPLKDKNDNIMKSIEKLQSSSINSNMPGTSKAPKAAKKQKSYEQMVIEAIVTLQERNGCSLQAIKKYIASIAPTAAKSIYISKCIKKCIEIGTIIQSTNKARYKLNPAHKKAMLKKDKENIAPKKMDKKKAKVVKEKIEKDKPTKKAKEDKKSTKKAAKPMKTADGNGADTKAAKKPKATKKRMAADEDGDEPTVKKVQKVSKNAKVDMKPTNKDEVTIKLPKPKSKPKPKLPVTKSATITAGNKLKKQARKSLILLNLKKQKMRKSKSQDHE